MDGIIVEQKIKELTKGGKYIKREDLPEILRLCGEVYTKGVVEGVIVPLIQRIELLEDEIDVHQADRGDLDL